MLTALSGWMVFGEKLPGLWWVGAAGLVVGNVVIGRRDEESGHASARNDDGVAEGERDGGERYKDWVDENSTEISDGVELLGQGGKSEESVQR